MNAAHLSSKSLTELAVLEEGAAPSPLQLNRMFWRPELRRRRPASRRPEPWFWLTSELPERSEN